MDITLAPYDILRLSRKLGLTSSEFLDTYTATFVHEESGLPMISLRRETEGKKGCPFNADEGCTVYEHRPSVCRYYPIGLAALRTKKDEQKEAGEERFYFLVKEDFCRGHDEEQEWTIDEWRGDQGPLQDDEINHDWQTAFLSRALPGQVRHDESRQNLFFLACYDLDSFRRFVFESPFLTKFEVDEETLAKIKEDDTELLRFGLRYMKYFMMIEETMKPRDEALAAWKKRHREAQDQISMGRSKDFKPDKIE
jgi:Fe-S-cluster containining protein